MLCLKEYERRTFSLRNHVSQLLVSHRKPHKAVSSPTLARWVKDVMTEGGVDVSVFGAHSLRGASASKAFTLGGSLQDILRAADWSNESMFKSCYFKPMSNVIDNVLNAL